ncbi:acyl-CoA synthetase family member 2, mitochondrial [Lingula anatina]|uniref:Acyl-CoA synthetase family member 2, mitochondrial n=1 Tax=Lingula anatina TaxID=7574 RepID=A0A1S3J1N4_LINAN|nr:acyl-CoA synthetase family member 2, mitochondrial [Lingula anatina]|eukprot:XP_013403734.1 acyl-CoA synthetase family member 2, mitochondrial [Lingula anatina]
MVYAAAQIGVVINAPAYAYRPRSKFLDIALNQLKSKTLVMIENQDGENVAALKELIPDLETFGGRNIQSERVPHLKNIIIPNVSKAAYGLSFEDVTKLGKDISEDDIQAARDAFTGDDPINTGLSSGSTGVPKCSVNSHFKAVNLLKFSLLRYADYKKPVVVGVGNPVHDELVADYVYWVSVENDKDIQLVILPSTLWDVEFQGENEDEGYHMEDLYKSIQECRITHLELYPTFLMKGLELDAEIVQKYDTSSVKRGILTSTVITEKLREQCSKLIPEFVVALGTTEYWNVSATYPLDDDFDRRYRGIGFPPPHTEVKIVDANNKIVPPGVEGEICVRGVFMFSTYYGSEDLYRKVVSQSGWYHTGDIGTMNEYGFMYYTGRKFHVLHFSRWGDKVYPAAIEIAAAKHPKISQAQAVGFRKPGEDDLDTIILCVIPIQGQNITEGELRSHCQSELLDHMWPDHYVVMETFPRVGIRQKVSKEELLKSAKNILLDSGKLKLSEMNQ